MPFPRLKVRFNGNFGSCARETTVTDPETGVVSTVMEDCNKPLPDSSMFQINNLVKAGVTLDEVNTKILSSGIDTEAFTSAVETVKKSTTKKKAVKAEEVKNEE